MTAGKSTHTPYKRFGDSDLLPVEPFRKFLQDLSDSEWRELRTQRPDLSRMVYRSQFESDLVTDKLVDEVGTLLGYPRLWEELYPEAYGNRLQIPLELIVENLPAHSPLKYRCPTCNVLPGEECVNRQNQVLKTSQTHRARRLLTKYKV